MSEAQPAPAAITTYGERSANAPKELGAFAFLVGKWEGGGKTKTADGEIVEFGGVTWIGRYILEGTLRSQAKPINRRATVADLPAIICCDDVAGAHDSRRHALERWVRNGECFLASETDEAVAGFVVLEHCFFGHGFVPLLCVRAGYRRRGIGFRLLAVAADNCTTDRLFTSTNASNIAAQRLFERAGFVRSGVIENLDADPELIYFKRRAVG